MMMLAFLKLLDNNYYREQLSYRIPYLILLMVYQQTHCHIFEHLLDQELNQMKEGGYKLHAKELTQYDGLLHS
jgi:hypothetical protein